MLEPGWRGSELLYEKVGTFLVVSPMGINQGFWFLFLTKRTRIEEIIKNAHISVSKPHFCWSLQHVQSFLLTRAPYLTSGSLDHFAVVSFRDQVSKA